MEGKRLIAAQFAQGKQHQFACSLARVTNQSVGKLMEPVIRKLQGAALKSLQMIKVAQTEVSPALQRLLKNMYPWISRAELIIMSRRVIDGETVTETRSAGEDLQQAEQRLRGLVSLSVLNEEGGERWLFKSVLQKLTPNALHLLEKIIRWDLDLASPGSVLARDLRLKLSYINLAWRRRSAMVGLGEGEKVESWKSVFMGHVVSDAGRHEGGLSDLYQSWLILIDQQA